MIDSARRTVNELGLRHALLEVEYGSRRDCRVGRRRSRCGRASFTKGLQRFSSYAPRRRHRRDRRAGGSHLPRSTGTSKPTNCAWRVSDSRSRAEVVDRPAHASGATAFARRSRRGPPVAEAAVALASAPMRWLTMATVSGVGDGVGRRWRRCGHEPPSGLDRYEAEGCCGAFAEKARRVVGAEPPPTPAPPASPSVEPDTAAVRARK